MKPPTQELLAEFQECFPTIRWSRDELQELVKPRFGLITGFPELLADIARLAERDLGDLPPAGPVAINRKT